MRDLKGVALRWGGPQVPGALNGSVHLLNGLEQLEAFRASETRCPDFTTDLEVALTWPQFFGRRLNHTQGRDIVAFGPDTPITGPLTRRLGACDFYTRFLPSIAEWRIHVLHGQSIARGKKVYTGHGTPGVIRSRRLGWTLEHRSEPPKGLRELARRAAKACKYELAAVDILQTGPKTFVALECNSRPAIRDPYTITQYERALRGLA